MSYTSPPVQKQHPCSETTSEPYKLAFHGGHLSHNMSHGCYDMRVWTDFGLGLGLGP